MGFFDDTDVTKLSLQSVTDTTGRESFIPLTENNLLVIKLPLMVPACGDCLARRRRGERLFLHTGDLLEDTIEWYKELDSWIHCAVETQLGRRLPTLQGSLSEAGQGRRLFVEMRDIGDEVSAGDAVQVFAGPCVFMEGEGRGRVHWISHSYNCR